MKILQTNHVNPEEEAEAMWEAMTGGNYSPKKKKNGRKKLIT